jgi:hypothetical protein
VVAGTGGDETRDPILFNHVLDKRIFCGEEIQGLDDTYHDGEALAGNTGEASEDIRMKLGYSLYFDRIDETVAYEDETTDDLSDDRRAFFQVFLRHQCFDQTSFNAAKHYHTYDWCRRRTTSDEMPSRSKVKKLLEENFPDKTFPSKTIEREKADKCVNWRNTGKIDSIYWHGGEKKVNYKKVCTKTVDRGMYEKELGVEPVVVADWEAEMLEEGMRVFVRSNSADPKDAVLVDAWHPDTDKPVVLQGVRVNQ